MSRLCIAAAQMTAVAGDLTANIATHCAFAHAAHAAGAELLLFPELSLCGYELPLLSQCLLTPQDPRLAPLRGLAQQLRMHIIVGAPIAGPHALPQIAAIDFAPDGSSLVYAKQFLHPGEDQFASAAERAAEPHALGSAHYCLSICADSSHPEHAADAAASGADLYLASVLISTQGYAADAGRLQQYARQHQLAVLLANHGGPSGGYQAAGRSAFWAPGGELLGATPGPGDYLLLARRQEGAWSTQVEALPLGNMADSR